MSKPVVAIGYILLIPSVLGMAASALVLCGVLSYGGLNENSNTAAARQPLTAEDAFRLSCINGSRRDPAFEEKQGRLTCECVLQAIEGQKDSSPEQNQAELRDATENLNHGRVDRNDVRLTAAMLYCAEHLSASSSLSPKGEQIYDRLEAPATTDNQSDAGTSLVHIVGGGLAIFWLVASFVAGLLGRLLVMKKRILQCTVCRATVSAS